MGAIGSRLDLFETGVGGDRPIRCRLCGARFRNWHGLSLHGLAHERKGTTRTVILGEPYTLHVGSSTDFGSGGTHSRYIFTLERSRTTARAAAGEITSRTSSQEHG